jgi:hypothetical protein
MALPETGLVRPMKLLVTTVLGMVLDVLRGSWDVNVMDVGCVAALIFSDV